MNTKEISLKLYKDSPADPENGRARSLHYHIIDKGTRSVAGIIDLRLSDSDDMKMYAGQVGYLVKPQFRGRSYAAKACLLLKKVAIKHKMSHLWITCNPENLASRITCERIGSQLVEIVHLPKENPLYQKGERRKCRYHWVL